MPTCSSVCLWQPTLSTCPICTCEKTIADLLQTEKEHAIIHYMNTQGGNDFGLFVIATATTLYAMGRIQLTWSISRIRCKVTSSRHLKWRPCSISLQRQQDLERGRNVVFFIGSVLQSISAADYHMMGSRMMMIQCWSLQPVVPCM